MKKEILREEILSLTESLNKYTDAEAILYIISRIDAVSYELEKEVKKNDAI